MNEAISGAVEWVKKWAYQMFVPRIALTVNSAGTADKFRVPQLGSTGLLDSTFLPATVVLDTEYTAADVLTKIKTVDGAASGLDADLLDGVDSTSYARTDTAETFDSNVQVTGLLLAQKHRAISNTTLADDATSTLTTAGAGMIYIMNTTDGHHFIGFFSSAGVTEVSDPSATWVQADTDTNNCLYWSSGLVLKNRRGGSRSYIYHIFGTTGVV